MTRRTTSAPTSDVTEETAVIDDAPAKQPQAPPAADDTDTAEEQQLPDVPYSTGPARFGTAEPASSPEFELLDIPAPLSQRGRGSKVSEAMERLGNVPAEIMSGIPEEVRTHTLADGENFDLHGVWRPAMNHVDGWLVCHRAAKAFPTVEALHEAGRLSDEDFQILKEASDRFAAADGNFSEPIGNATILDTRRALKNVNRVINGEEPVTRKMVEERRAENAVKATEPKQRREPKQKKAAEPQTNGDADANQVILALTESWKEFRFNPSDSNCRAVFNALRPLKGSPAYSLIQAELDRQRRR